MRKYNKKNKKMLLIILLLSVTIGFALISTTLNINGIAGINKNTWDIHWNENSIVETQGSVTATTPAYVSDTAKKNVTFAVNLELPGDFYEFTVDAKNYGTISGLVDEVKIKIYEGDSTTPLEPEDIPEYLIYSFTHTDGSAVQQGEEIKPNESRKYKFKIGIDEEYEEVPAPEPKPGPTPTPTPAPSYVAEIEVVVVQKPKDNYKTYEVGDIVYFDPVKYEICDEDQSSFTCYRWVTTKADAPKYDLFLLDTIYDFQWTNGNPIQRFEWGVTNWNSKLTVDPSYDITVQETGYTLNFSSTKARILTKGEYDNLNARAKNLIDISCGKMSTTNNCGFLDTDTKYVYQLTPSGMQQTFPFLAFPNAALGDTTDQRPVVRIDLSDGVGNATKTTKVLQTGSIVYFDPINANNTCDEKNYYHGKVIVQDDTCYRWRVIDTDNPNSKSNLNIQLDHNTVNATMWTTKNQGYEEIGPDNILTKVQETTANWTRVPYLDDYEYDTAEVLPIALNEASCRDPYDSTKANRCYYGKLTVNNGALTIDRYNTTIYSVNNLRARVITAEEVRDIANTIADQGALTRTWTLGSVTSNTGAFVTSHKNQKIGYKFFDTSGTNIGSTSLSWLLENTYNYDSETSSGRKKSDFYDGTDNTVNGGYWTISPTSDNDNNAWAVTMDSGQGDGLRYATAYNWSGYAHGVRPVININKSLTK